MKEDKNLLEFVELQKKFIENNFSQTNIHIKRKESENTTKRSDIFSRLSKEIREYETV